jgi:hypothetical protein
LNPTHELALQVSWASVHSPEQLEPDLDQRKLSASALYTRALGEQGSWASTLAWGRRSSPHGNLDAYAIESTIQAKDVWTVFGRAERVDNDELLSGGPAYTVGKFSIGVIRDLRVAEHLKVGIGGLFAFNFVPAALEPAYGGDPHGAMAFVRLKVD